MDIKIGLIIIILVVFGAILITVNFLIKSLNNHHALNYRLDNLEYKVGELTKK